MERIKSFLKRDSEFLRNTILFLMAISFGVYKLFFQPTHRTNSVIVGIVLLVAALTFFIPTKGKETKIK